MSQIFKTQIQIKFHEADPVGIMYFANIFTLAHDSFEVFIQKAGYTWAQWFNQRKHIFPIRHTECDYLRPFKAGDVYDIEIVVAEFSTSSFKMQYTFKQNGHDHAIVNMVQTCLDGTTFKKINLPEEVKQKLSPYLKEV